jgi:hypothetical protein
MNKEQANKWIHRHWNVGSGKKITEMLRRYWSLCFKEIKTAKSVEKLADEVFDK